MHATAVLQLPTASRLTANSARSPLTGKNKFLSKRSNRAAHVQTSKRQAPVLAYSNSSSPSPPLGTFIRDVAASDMKSYEKTLGLLGLGKIQQLTAIQLIEGLEVTAQGDNITLKFLTVVPFFNVLERYSLKGSSSFGRRDLRPGHQLGNAAFNANGALCLKSTWGEPKAGAMEEVMSLAPDGSTLEVIATLTVGGKQESTRQIYRKVETWNPQKKWNPIAALSMLAKGN